MKFECICIISWFDEKFHERGKSTSVGNWRVDNVFTAHTSIAVGMLPIICMHLSDDAQMSITIHMINMNAMVRMNSKARVHPKYR